MKRWLAPALACLVLPSGATLAADAPAGASSCTGCHSLTAASTTDISTLSNQRASAIGNALREFKNGARPSTVMGRIAKGFSDPEISAIAQWFGKPSQ